MNDKRYKDMKLKECQSMNDQRYRELEIYCV